MNVKLKSLLTTLLGTFCLAAVACTTDEPAPTAVPESVTIAADRHSTLYESDDGSRSNGAGENFFVGRTNGGALRRGLVRFPVESAVPDGATVTSVRLVLHLSRSSSEDQPVSLHRVLADWGEGPSIAEFQGGTGGPSESNDATWVHRFWDTETWTTPGGEFEQVSSATTDVALLSDEFTWTSDQMVDDVQRWLDDPETNFGWLLKGNEDIDQTTKRFRSRESPRDAERPALLVEFRREGLDRTTSTVGPFVFGLTGL